MAGRSRAPQPRERPRTFPAQRRQVAHRSISPTRSCRAAAPRRSHSMCPAALAHLVCGICVQPLAGTQPLYQLASKLDVTALLIARGLHLPQPLTGPANDQIVKSDALSAVAKRVECVPNGRRLGDRVARVAGRHERSVAPRCSTAREQGQPGSRSSGEPTLLARRSACSASSAAPGSWSRCPRRRRRPAPRSCARTRACTPAGGARP